MTRNLKAFGLALVAVLALSAVAVSSAQAVEHKSLPAKFTFGAGATKVDGTQIGTNLFTIEGLPAMTCTTANLNGAVAGAEPETVELVPTYETCHIVLFGITKPITFTVNGCAFVLTATTTQTETGVLDFTAHTKIKCPAGKQIEYHIYNNAAHTETLCTYDIREEGNSNLTEISLTNIVNTPASANDIEAHYNLKEVTVHRTIGGALCGSKETPKLTYVGTTTLRATNAAGEFVHLAISK